MDLRDRPVAEGIAKLVLGITGQRPGERLIARTTAQVTGPVLIPSDSLFRDEVLELLFNYPTLILLDHDACEEHVR